MNRDFRRALSRTLWSALVVAFALGGSGLGQSAAVEPPSVAWRTPVIEAPRVSYHEFDSRAAGTRVSYHVYTPAAYGRDAASRFPVVYWLHGSGGGLPGIAPLAREVDAAIESGKVPPFLLVFVNGLRLGMYVDWKDGSVPLERVIVEDLVRHVDATYRTRATREGRLLDGFSMGGYGAARLGFKYPEMFRAVSILGAGPLQERLTDAPRAGENRAKEVLHRVYGGSPAYFLAVSPRRHAADNAAKIARDSFVRVAIGDRDNTFANNLAFHEHLRSLRIPHDWIVVEGVGHDPLRLLRALGDRHWAFYREAFR
jgi:enterochelin esterase-like enzyme